MPTAKKPATKKTRAKKAAPKKTEPKMAAPKKAAPKKAAPKAPEPRPKTYLINLSTDFGQFQIPFRNKEKYEAALQIARSAPSSVQGQRSPMMYKISNDYGAEIVFRCVHILSTQES